MGSRSGGSKTHQISRRQPQHHRIAVRRRIEAAVQEERIHSLRASRDSGRRNFGCRRGFSAQGDRRRTAAREQ